MYDFIADRNSYNKEVYSANFYSFLFPHAKEFNKAYNEILKTKEMFILQKCDKPFHLIYSSGHHLYQMTTFPQSRLSY